MTIIYERLTGYGRMTRMITYVSAFHEIFKCRGSMKFFDGDFSGVCDVALEKSGALSITTYPHNNQKFVSDFVEKNESAVKIFMESLIKSHEAGTGIRKTIFTLNFSYTSTIAEVTRKNFYHYHPSREPRAEMFIFEGIPFETGGFPNIFLMEKSARTGPYERALPIFAACSHDVFDTISIETLVGKQLVWCLYDSWLHGAFESKIPDLFSMHLPTNGHNNIPPFLNHADLLLWGEKMGQGLVQKGKEIVHVKPEDVFAPAEDPKNPFGVVDEVGIKTWVEQGIKTTGTVNLSDLHVLGIGKTLELVENPDVIINVHLDTVIGVRKMCLYQGLIHYIPASIDFDPVNYFDEDAEVFKAETEDSYPRYLQLK